ncbi:Gamma-D-glutamyl-L-lysine endopeptidase|uniref:C40 family peptidase n=2 Tax=unclassified Neochlamydia TaxID=2643326 RepID=UPI00140AAF89|nr:C40 family peptidase [Neochlamydia sp. AcF84]NGY95385.1 Gamma-D-glutamyl-L-lysine endopeptidase [Neochlamydia sp. AcF84]
MMNCVFLASTLLFHYINVPVTNMRELPKDTSEIVSQAYFSEQVNVIEENLDWTKVETTIDHYQGWVKSNQLCHEQNNFYENSCATAKVNRCMAHLYHVPDTIYGPILTIPFESVLKVIDLGNDNNSRWVKVLMFDEREAFIQRGDIILNQAVISRDQIVPFSLQFLGLPYTWGGRSSFGYDCSGFVQMLYRQMGVYLPRDAKDQVKWEGLAPIEINDMLPSDLIFFGLSEDKIRHVGMYIGSGQFIHATVAENAPYIHISSLSDPEWNGSGKWIYRTARTLRKKNNA